VYNAGSAVSSVLWNPGYNTVASATTDAGVPLWPSTPEMPCHAFHLTTLYIPAPSNHPLHPCLSTDYHMQEPCIFSIRE